MMLPCVSPKTWISMWRGDIFFDQDAARAERRADFPNRSVERVVEVGVLVDAPHPAPAAARRRLDQHRVADLVSFLLEEFRVLAIAVIAGHYWNAGFLHQRLGAVLKPHRADRRGGRTNEDEAGAGASLGEIRILGQEPVAGVNALGSGLVRDLDQFVGREIALARFRGADEIGLVAKARM